MRAEHIRPCIRSFPSAIQTAALAFSYWSSFTEASENLRTSVKGGLDTRLSAFNQHFIRKMLSENAIDLEKPGQEKCAYFCIISDQETSLSYISSLFITVAFETLRSQADSLKEKRLSRRVMFYLDEFANSVTRSTPKTVGITDKSVA